MIIINIKPTNITKILCCFPDQILIRMTRQKFKSYARNCSTAHAENESIVLHLV
jgi:hypothetical protein